VTADPRPCRPYVLGEHARALRNRVLLGTGIALVASMVLPSFLWMLLPFLGTAFAPAVDPAAEIIDAGGFAVVYLLTLWLAVGPRRLAAMEILVWGSRYATAGYSAVTGIRDATDGEAAAEWLRTHPAPADEAPEARYWRAYAHLVAGDLAGARAALARLLSVEGYAYAVASLEAQIALAEGSQPDLAAVEAAAAAWPDALGRAVAMANLGALRAQHAFVCGGDDVAAARSVRTSVGGRPSRYFLLRAWLPIIGLTIGAIILGRLVGTS
jgi:hypothetical protein